MLIFKLTYPQISKFTCIILLAGQMAFAQTKDFTPEHQFTKNCEGPAVDADGNVYAVNYIMDGTVAQMNRRGKTDIFLTLPKGSTGNGIRFGSKNTFFIADFTGHNILKTDLATQKVSVHAHEPRMNQPNDLCMAKNGHIFCSDPNWQASTGQVWHVSPTGKATLVAPDMGTTNGVELSPDEKTLYVNESVQRNVWAFDVQPDYSLTNKRLIVQFADGAMDGMRCDANGNLYITRWGKGEVNVLSPQGKVLKIITTKGKNVSNICFGGKKGRTCYVTLQDRGCLETFKADAPGREWAMMQDWQKNESK
ncbi:MAG: SMP-30/gluconolactonase/LRE family protein [Runella slithyformis]|nr:MAG: SMP-30/gluconolactonase/LRE family protein [Runella slithyformis]TAE90488.1 MAG: SMP-30/gluconolactonase/LRE family protein [Runella slithyformis]TAF29822.1 MAG: SMP-30/gluconolactonase/LRE family protein [Runella slithyformis]TAF48827.1 MAG: SMP-30/gluconolactonase/LRE family protein [Runella slithyformis]TAF83410.1 MAG: SMP-30/gluconolactonase/LRE family protein [Runella slithyformis]